MTVLDSEETPLLQPELPPAVKLHEQVYDRFTTRRKHIILTLTAFCGLLPLFVSGSFYPSVPQIAKDLESTGEVVSLAISVSVFTVAFGSLFWATYSGFYGRRPIYLSSLPLLCIGSLAVGLARSIPELMVARVVQAAGSSVGLSVGAAVIGDIYKLEERGTAMGVFFGAVLLGPALAPLAGGIAAHYASWRVMQFALGISGLVAFISMWWLFPETTHPNSRGIDRIVSTPRPLRFVWINPLKSLWLLRSPNLLAVALAGLTVLFTDYVLLVPLSYTIGARYGITNEALIGACFIPCGLGNLIGAPVAGHISDRIVVKYRSRRGGEWVPEDRLRATLVGAAIFIPFSVLCSGLLTQFVDGKVGLVLNLICLFVNGFGVDLVLSPSAAYCVDVVHARSAESIAANNGFRSILLSLAIAGILPSIRLFGVAATNALAALVAWVGFALLWGTIRYGDRMRAWVDVGYSTAENN